MDALPNFTAPAVDATSPQLDTTRDELPEDDILEVTEYHGTAKAYSSDDDVCFSDHPSEAPSDLALAVRDESFAPVPLMVGRTYLSSGESFGIAEVNGADRMVEDIASFGDGIHRPENFSNYMDRGDSIEEREDDGYTSVENNIDNNDDIRSAINFKATDPVPVCRAQELFVMAWNGETSSCGEDVGDIETIPSDAEINGIEDEDKMSKRECGSIHTLESSEEILEAENNVDTHSQGVNKILTSIAPESAKGTTAQQVTAIPHIETGGTSHRPIACSGVHSKDTIATHSSADCFLSVLTKVNVMSNISIVEAVKLDGSEEKDVEPGSHFERNSDIKASTGKKQKVFKFLTRVCARCFGRE